MGEPGDGNWEDRMIDPADPRFVPALERFCQRLIRHRMRAIFDCFADVTSFARAFGLKRHVDQILDVLERYPDVVLYLKISNEGDGLTEDEVRELVDHVKSRSSFPVGGKSDMDYGDIYPARTERKITGDGGMWDHTEQPYDMHQHSAGVLSDEEPIGPGSSLASDEDPLRNAAHAACVYTTGGTVYVLHCRAGVRGGGKADEKYGPWKNLWEHHDWPELVRMIAEVRNFYPHDCAGWTSICHTNPRCENNYPFKTEPLQPHDPGGWFLKSYSNRDGSRFVSCVQKIEKDVPLEAYRETRVVTSDLRDSRRSAELSASQRLTLTERGAVVYRGE